MNGSGSVENNQGARYPSRQDKFSRADIMKRLSNYEPVAFEELVNCIGEWIRYFRDGQFRTGGWLTRVDLESEYVCFKNTNGVRWSAPKDGCVFWAKKRMKSSDIELDG